MADHSGFRSFDCPHCGEEVPLGLSRCRACGASEECGWSETDGHLTEGHYGGDDGFDYDEFVAREFGADGEPPQAERRDLQFRLVILAIVISLLLPLIVAYVW